MHGTTSGDLPPHPLAGPSGSHQVPASTSTAFKADFSHLAPKPRQRRRVTRAMKVRFAADLEKARKLRESEAQSKKRTTSISVTRPTSLSRPVLHSLASNNEVAIPKEKTKNKTSNKKSTPADGDRSSPEIIEVESLSTSALPHSNPLLNMDTREALLASVRSELHCLLKERRSRSSPASHPYHTHLGPEIAASLNDEISASRNVLVGNIATPLSRHDSFDFQPEVESESTSQSERGHQLEHHMTNAYPNESHTTVDGHYAGAPHILSPYPHPSYLQPYFSGINNPHILHHTQDTTHTWHDTPILSQSPDIIDGENTYNHDPRLGKSHGQSQFLTYPIPYHPPVVMYPINAPPPPPVTPASDVHWERATTLRSTSPRASHNQHPLPPAKLHERSSIQKEDGHGSSGTASPAHYHPNPSPSAASAGAHQLSELPSYSFMVPLNGSPQRSGQPYTINTPSEAPLQPLYQHVYHPMAAPVAYAPYRAPPKTWTEHFEAIYTPKKRGRGETSLKRGRPDNNDCEEVEKKTNNLSCPLCPKTFSRGNSLAIHMKWHYKKPQDEVGSTFTIIPRPISAAPSISSFHPGTTVVSMDNTQLDTSQIQSQPQPDIPQCFHKSGLNTPQNGKGFVNLTDKPRNSSFTSGLNFLPPTIAFASPPSTPAHTRSGQTGSSSNDVVISSESAQGCYDADMPRLRTETGSTFDGSLFSSED